MSLNSRGVILEPTDLTIKILEDPFGERIRGNGLFMNPTKTKTNKVYLVKFGQIKPKVSLVTVQL